MKNKIINLPVFSTGSTMPVHVLETLCDKKSKYQQIEILDTLEFGKCLIIDGCMQTAETDHKLYDTHFLFPLDGNNKNILILGGGDGYIAMHVTKKHPHLNITVVEIDEDVIKLTGQYIHSNDRTYKSINFIVSDALLYLKNNNSKFDAILCDLTDTPVGTKEIDDFKAFYYKLLREIHRNLNIGGWVILQAGSTEVDNKYIPAIHILKKSLSDYFPDIKESSVYIPSYGEDWSFLYATKI